MFAGESLGYYVARAVLVALSLGGLGVVGYALRWAGRWIRAAILDDIRSAISDVTKDDIASLKTGQADLRTAFNTMRDLNSEEHKMMRDGLADNTRRLDHLEGNTP